MTHYKDLPKATRDRYEAGGWIPVTRESVINDIDVELCDFRGTTLQGCWDSVELRWVYRSTEVQGYLPLTRITHYKKLSPRPNDTKTERPPESVLCAQLLGTAKKLLSIAQSQQLVIATLMQLRVAPKDSPDIDFQAFGEAGLKTQVQLEAFEMTLRYRYGIPAGNK